MTVRLEPLAAATLAEAIRVEMTEEQRRFVTTPFLSDFLADDAEHPTYTSHWILDRDAVVGFVSVGHEPGQPDRWWVPLLVVDRRHQRQGYGREAMRVVIERARATPGCAGIGLSYHPDNLAAEALYRGLGFQPTGMTEAGQVEAWLALGRRR